MPIYRRVVAEMRRVHRDAEWVAVAFLLDDRWVPLPGIEPAGPRLREAGLVAAVPLLPVLASDDRRALAAAIAQVRDAGLLTSREAPRRAVLRGTRSALVVPSG